MQTFLPYSDFTKSAECLDNKRLWKQVLEADGILKLMWGYNKGYRNHPITKMWDGYSDALVYYRNECVREWLKRRLFFGDTMYIFDTTPTPKQSSKPLWLGNERLHSSHRAALLKKDFGWYSQFGWTEEPKIEYWWAK